MENLITKKELFEIVDYVMNKVKEGEQNLSLEIKQDYVKITELESISKKELSIDEFIYDKVEGGYFTEKTNLDMKIKI